MLHELFRTGQQLLHMIGMACLLWGTFAMVGALFSHRGPVDYGKGIVLLLFGVYLHGLARTLS